MIYLIFAEMDSPISMLEDTLTGGDVQVQTNDWELLPN